MAQSRLSRQSRPRGTITPSRQSRPCGTFALRGSLALVAQSNFALRGILAFTAISSSRQSPIAYNAFCHDGN
eukprot:scaffold20651_cov42-Cyclotella_meneghiniana.AAC.4